MENKEKGYDDSIIDKIIDIINTIEYGKGITSTDFMNIETALKSHRYYEEDDIYYDDVEHYCEYEMGSWERTKLLRVLNVTDNDDEDRHELLNDDEYRMELLLKMYKSTSTILELETMINSSKMEKLNNVIL